MKRIYTNHYVHLALAVLVGGAITYGFDVKHEDIKNTITREQNSAFVLTSPILDCESVGEIDSAALPHTEVQKKIEALAKKHDVSSYSVYFRNLNEGQWLGVNERDFFAPASMMKTPLLIAFLKRVEQAPRLLDMEVEAEQVYFDRALTQNFDVATKIEKGKTYTLRQVAEIMIGQSDNVAALMLSKYIRQEDYQGLFDAVGVVQKQVDQDIDVRVKDFAAFFRVLYNASYLSREMSELALSILSQSAFTGGIAAGVPSTTTVAHKYGERSIEQEINGMRFVKDRQLHDCGIIYADTAPYILCVMTKGQNFVTQQGFIADVSTYIYEQTKK